MRLVSSLMLCSAVALAQHVRSAAETAKPSNCLKNWGLILTDRNPIGVGPEILRPEGRSETRGRHALKSILPAMPTAYFSKPRMYGMTGGRGPVLKSGPRVER